MYVYICLYIYKYAYIHTYIYTYVCVYIHVCRSVVHFSQSTNTNTFSINQTYCHCLLLSILICPVHPSPLLRAVLTSAEQIHVSVSQKRNVLYIASPCTTDHEHAALAEWSVCIMFVNSPIYWARVEGWVTGKRLMLESMVKWSRSGIFLTPWPHLRRWGFCMSAILKTGPLVVRSDGIICLPFQGMATSKGRSWRTSSGSWKWPGKEQAS